MTGRDLLVEKIALAFIPGMTAGMVMRMNESGLLLKDFYEIGMPELQQILGAGNYPRLDSMLREEALFKARNELEFIERHSIKVYYLGDDDYPVLLREIPDAPVILFQLGNTELDGEHILNMVGTRRNTPYSVNFCNTFIKNLSEYFPDTIIVSGLAFGIDSLAHKGALENGLRTVAVVAHGLDTIYPAANRDLARRIIKGGGSVLSEYPSGTVPYRRRFLERNRIVAGLSEFTLVVESPVRGGAMSTANTAFSYSRDVGAVPGRVGDEMSEGCNLLIRKQKANLITSVADMIELLGWKPAGIAVQPKQRNLFPELNGEAKSIFDALKLSSLPMSVDQLFQKTRIHIPALMSTLTELEFDGIIIRHPGNRYSPA